MESRVFISYARENADLARALKQDLEETGHRCWIDTSDLRPGAEFEQRIADAVAACYAFVVLVSPAANARPWVARERRMARRHERSIFPARAEDCPLPADLSNLQAAVLLAGLHAEDCTPVIDWLLEAQPEVAGQCMNRGGAKVSPETLKRARAAWTPRLSDLARDPGPAARAAIGRALATEVDGEMLDERPGVGVYRNPKIGVWLPDIDWVSVPAGQFVYQDGERRELPAFEIARYPVTNRQFRCFVDDGGYETDEWWQGLAEQIAAPEAPSWPEGNHPRETVSWYEAVAFYRWLRARAECEVRLPTELEWEKAARGTDGREFPWGDGYRAGYANINETSHDLGPNYLERTTAVGIYPNGASSVGALDVTGNVWEWCLNPVEDPESTSTEGDNARALRGGSWNNTVFFARAGARVELNPRSRYGYLGFRVCRRSPIANC